MINRLDDNLRETVLQTETGPHNEGAKMPGIHPSMESRGDLGIRPRWILAAVFLLAFPAAGCATRGSMIPSNSGILSREEIAPVSVSTAYELIERLRPGWLLSRTPRSFNMRTEIAVVQDGAYYGNLSSLRSISAQGLLEIHYLSSSEAANAFPNMPRGRTIEAAIVLYRASR